MLFIKWLVPLESRREYSKVINALQMRISPGDSVGDSRE